MLSGGIAVSCRTVSYCIYKKQKQIGILDDGKTMYLVHVLQVLDEGYINIKYHQLLPEISATVEKSIIKQCFGSGSA